jgi:hypothetical protein
LPVEHGNALLKAHQGPGERFYSAAGELHLGGVLGSGEFNAVARPVLAQDFHHVGGNEMSMDINNGRGHPGDPVCRERLGAAL